jgi:hypothetical protein
MSCSACAVGVGRDRGRLGASAAPTHMGPDRSMAQACCVRQRAACCVRGGAHLRRAAHGLLAQPLHHHLPAARILPQLQPGDGPNARTAAYTQQLWLRSGADPAQRWARLGMQHGSAAGLLRELRRACGCDGPRGGLTRRAVREGSSRSLMTCQGGSGRPCGEASTESG